jgi:hypothetical protein
MNDDRKAQGASRDDESEHLLEQLFAHAEPRLMPPEADTEEVRRAVYAEWEAAARRRVLTRRTGLAAAASIVLAVAVWFGAPGPSSLMPVVAQVERVEGLVEGANGESLVVGSSVVISDVLGTRAGQLALRLASGGSLRVGAQTRVVLTSADAVDLRAGVLYFDSEDERAGADFTVTTSLGAVRDIGTQFLARVDDSADRLDVGVRDGRVALTTSKGAGEAGVGERLTVTQDASEIQRDTMATFGEEWAWAERLAPPFEIDGRTFSDFLAWFAQQTGRTIVFASPEAERLARDSVLRGAIDLAPLPKLQAVVETTALTYALDSERVVIDLR